MQSDVIAVDKYLQLQKAITESCKCTLEVTRTASGSVFSLKYDDVELICSHSLDVIRGYSLALRDVRSEKGKSMHHFLKQEWDPKNG